MLLIIVASVLLGVSIFLIVILSKEKHKDNINKKAHTTSGTLKILGNKKEYLKKPSQKNLNNDIEYIPPKGLFDGTDLFPEFGTQSMNSPTISPVNETVKMNTPDADSQKFKLLNYINSILRSLMVSRGYESAVVTLSGNGPDFNAVTIKYTSFNIVKDVHVEKHI